MKPSLVECPRCLRVRMSADTSVTPCSKCASSRYVVKPVRRAFFGIPFGKTRWLCYMPSFGKKYVVRDSEEEALAAFINLGTVSTT